MNENDDSTKLNPFRERLILSIADRDLGGSATEVARCVEALIDAKIELAFQRYAQQIVDEGVSRYGR